MVRRGHPDERVVASGRAIPQTKSVTREKVHVTCGTAHEHTAVPIIPQAHQHSSKATLHAALETFSLAKK